MPATKSRTRKHLKVRTGDTVRVIAGKDRGKDGKILRVFGDEGRVVVDGVNVVKRHVKRQGSQPGQIIEMEKSVHVSNVALLDPETKTPTRVGFSFDGGKKTRIAKKSGKPV